MIRNKLNISQINDTICDVGGAESYVQQLKALSERHGYTVHIFGSKEGVSLGESFFSRWYSRKFYKQAYSAMQRSHPSIVHIHNCSRAISPSVIKAAFDLNIPVVQTVHDYHYICPKLWMIDDKGNEVTQHGKGINCLMHHLPKKSLVYGIPKHIKAVFHEYLINKYVDHFICPSKTLYGFYRNRYSDARVSYIPNFFNPSKHPPSLIAEDNKNLVFVGRVSREKGIDVLISAFEIVAKKVPTASLTIIGEGPEKERLIVDCHARGLSGKVKFLGKINNELLPNHYQQAAIVVIPSVWMENCPMVALEAISAQRPIIGSNMGGLKDLIIDNKTGYLFERNNHNDLAGKISSLLSNTSKLQEFSSNQGLLSSKFSATEHIKAISELYDELVKK